MVLGSLTARVKGRRQGLFQSCLCRCFSCFVFPPWGRMISTDRVPRLWKKLGLQGNKFRVETHGRLNYTRESRNSVVPPYEPRVKEGRRNRGKGAGWRERGRRGM